MADMAQEAVVHQAQVVEVVVVQEAKAKAETFALGASILLENNSTALH